jgi:hypothetical protein
MEQLARARNLENWAESRRFLRDLIWPPADPLYGNRLSRLGRYLLRYLLLGKPAPPVGKLEISR